MPYLYSLSLESHLFATPPQRWTGWGMYEADPEVWTEKLTKGEKQFWLGDALLVGGVYSEGKDKAKMYLPRGSVATTTHSPYASMSSSVSSLAASIELTPGQLEGYINLSAPNEYLPAGAWATIKSEWKDSIPILVSLNIYQVLIECVRYHNLGLTANLVGKGW
jgi:hypothetical protein